MCAPCTAPMACHAPAISYYPPAAPTSHHVTGSEPAALPTTNACPRRLLPQPSLSLLFQQTQTRLWAPSHACKSACFYYYHVMFLPNDARCVCRQAAVKRCHDSIPSTLTRSKQAPKAWAQYLYRPPPAGLIQQYNSFNLTRVSEVWVWQAGEGTPMTVRQKAARTVCGAGRRWWSRRARTAAGLGARSTARSRGAAGWQRSGRSAAQGSPCRSPCAGRSCQRSAPRPAQRSRAAGPPPPTPATPHAAFVTAGCTQHLLGASQSFQNLCWDMQSSEAPLHLSCSHREWQP